MSFFDMFKWSQSDKDAYNAYMKNKQKEGGIFNLLGPVKGIAKALLGEKAADSIINQYTKEDVTGSERAVMDFNAQEAQKQRDWQEEMSNTSYQRAVTDMQAAGLNPALAYGQGGATTPSGSTASASAAGGAGIMAFIDFLAKMKGLEIQDKQIAVELQNADTNAYNAETERSKVDVGNELTAAMKEQQDLLNQILEATSPDKIRQAKSDADVSEKTAENLGELKKVYENQADLIEKQAATEEEKVSALAAQAYLQTAQAWQLYQLTPIMKQIQELNKESLGMDVALQRMRQSIEELKLTFQKQFSETKVFQESYKKTLEQNVEIRLGKSKQEWNKLFHPGFLWELGRTFAAMGAGSSMIPMLGTISYQGPQSWQSSGSSYGYSLFE